MPLRHTLGQGSVLAAALLFATPSPAQTDVYRTTVDNSPFLFAPPPEG
jgi:hypothetical protein